MSQTISNHKAAALQASIREIQEKLAEAEALTEVSLRMKDAVIQRLEAENHRLREQNRQLREAIPMPLRCAGKQPGKEVYVA